MKRLPWASAEAKLLTGFLAYLTQAGRAGHRDERLGLDQRAWGELLIQALQAAHNSVSKDLLWGGNKSLSDMANEVFTSINEDGDRN